MARRVTHSSMAVDAHAMVDCIHAALHSRALLRDLFGVDLKIIVATDCASLHRHLSHGDRVPRDKSLVRSLAQVRSLLSTAEVSTVALIASSDNIADCLTRTHLGRGMTSKLLHIMTKGALVRFDTFAWMKVKGHVCVSSPV